MSLKDMTKSQVLQKQFQQAVSRLNEVLKEEKTDIVRDSAIKRFEFTFDLAWKLLKALLEEEKGVICASPKDCFREAYKNGIISYDEYFLEMTNWRNEIVHSYNQEFADFIYEQLPEALKHFQSLEKKIPFSIS